MAIRGSLNIRLCGDDIYDGRVVDDCERFGGVRERAGKRSAAAVSTKKVTGPLLPSDAVPTPVSVDRAVTVEGTCDGGCEVRLPQLVVTAPEGATVVLRGLRFAASAPEEDADDYTTSTQASLALSGTAAASVLVERCSFVGAFYL